jgi:hypothetical protein
MSVLDSSSQSTPAVRRSDDYCPSENSNVDLKITEEEKEFLCSVCNRLLKMSNRMQATAYEGTGISPEKLEELLKKLSNAK